MAATYHLKIMTPSSAVFDGDIESMVAPGEAGYLGVLANHAPLITTLMNGHLSVRKEDGQETWFRVNGGILRVAKNTATLLSEEVEELEGRPADI